MFFLNLNYLHFTGKEMHIRSA